MPPPTYSERFLQQNVGAQWAQYRVGAGHRASVKSISATNWGPSASRIHVEIGGYYVALLEFPAAITATVMNLTAVAYAGELIEAYIDGSQAHVSISGFLFIDDARAVADQLPAAPAGDRDPPAYLLPRPK